MAVPVLLVTGFLGAGKTTLINHLLSAADGRRIAAVVNDFGAINIDAELLANSADGVVALQNGCICCSLQGDLLRTLSRLLKRDPPPDAIVIETSGVSDPAEIVRSLLDPVIWREASLETVIALADARALADEPARLDDPLCHSQVAAADIVALNKADLVTVDELQRVRALLAKRHPGRAIFEVSDGRIAPELAFAGDIDARRPPADASPGATRRAHGFSTPQFETLTFTARKPFSLARFQAAIQTLSPRLVRAKGFLAFTEQAGKPMLFQLVGQRATLGPAPSDRDPTWPVRLVLIAENGKLDHDETHALLQACVQG